MDHSADGSPRPGQESYLRHPIEKPKSLIGTIGFKDVDTEHAQAEMGFCVGVEFWGKGYAAEAAKASKQTLDHVQA